MTQELGETRDAMGWAVWKKAQEIAEETKDVKQFYIVYAAKPDPALFGAVVNGFVARGGIRDAWRICTKRPQPFLGILVWYVDHDKSLFEFQPDLSSPPDIPLDPELLSDRSEDQLVSIMEKGKQMNVLVS